MFDINGNEVKVGDKCKFYFELRDEWIIGTVRKVSTYTYRYSYQLMNSKTVWEAKVDNGCNMAAIVETNKVEIIKEQ